ncbi:MAG: NUDIX hydrolase [Chloroflexota bacterium]
MGNHKHPTITTVDGKRKFDCFPAAVVAVIVNAEEKILMFAHPKRNRQWETVSGGLEKNETFWEGVLREVAEEIGSKAKVHPLGSVHTGTFQYDPNASHMLSLSVVLTYESGEIVPGDDMAGSEFGWFTADELNSGDMKILSPLDRPMIVNRALGLYRLWKTNPPTWEELQPPLETERVTIRSK